jgi:hypothetical protein
MMHFRQGSEHVIKRGGAQNHDDEERPYSAHRAIVGYGSVRRPRCCPARHHEQAAQHRLKMLEEAERRILALLDRASPSG